MEPTGIIKNIVWSLGPLQIAGSVVITWTIIFALCGAAKLFTRKLSLSPGKIQTLIEGVFLAAEDTIQAILPNHAQLIFPFVATLWLFILITNLVGLLPGIDSPTSDLSVTSGLAILVFLSVHWFGIKTQGLKNYLRHYFTPSPIMFPFHIISEISRTLALALRLFGNIVSLQLGAFIVLMIAGFLVPIPLLMLHIVEAVIQAYIFGMLALIYIASGIQYHELRIQKEQGE
ncbi:MAG: F0F1 ATP synthase subunit A [Gammaproteobacteria bacterium]|nr:F0F1 ATP synthase subunit A [Gammaproteobacteria bacterium]